MPNNLKFSIITPTLNQASYIEDTIKSVLNQNYDNFEHIIIDGGSKDGTLDILKKYKHLKWVSEKDTGQSNAINKGFKMASGEVVAWLNSDDYYDVNAFQYVNEFFNNTNCKVLFGDITYIDENGKKLFNLSGDDISFEKLLKYPDNVRQPSTFWKRSVIEDIGLLNESLHLVMDLDLFLRIGKKYEFKYLNKNLSYFRYYKDNKTLSMLRRQTFEMYAVLKQYKNLDFHDYKFLLGRFLDSLNDKNIIKKILSLLRKKS